MDELIMICKAMPDVEDLMAKNFNLSRYWQAGDKAQFLADRAGTRFISTDGHYGCSAAIMDALPKLEIIACNGIGTDAIDLAAAKARGIFVTNTPDIINDAAAELALGLMLALARRIVDADQFIRAGKWLNGGYPLATELTGAKIGILGLGHIGKEVALRAEAFKMQVSYYGRTRQADQPYPYYDNLLDMAQQVDWLVACLPGGDETEGLLDRKVLEALGPNGSIVNIGRGSLIDEPVMIEMLKSGALAGAALDVFAEEPKMSEELWSMSNVVLSPHQGSATLKTRMAMGDLMVRNLKAIQSGKPAITPVS